MIALDELKLVRALYKTGSIHSAAQELGMSQPAVSKRVARMEDKLGVTIFHRSNRGTTLTHFGERLLSRGEELLDKSAQLRREIELMAGLELAELRIGVGPIIEYLYLPRTMSRLLSKYPNVSFDVKVDNAAKLLEGLKNRDVDVAVGYFPGGDAIQNMCQIPLKTDDLVFVVRAGHPALQKISSGETVSLFAYPMALPDLPTHFQEWFEAQRDQSGFKNAQLKCDNYHIIKSVIHNSDHVTGAPRSLFQAELENGSFEIFPTDLDIMSWGPSVLFTPEAQYSPIVQAFQEEIDKVSRQPVPDNYGPVPF